MYKICIRISNHILLYSLTFCNANIAQFNLIQKYPRNSKELRGYYYSSFSGSVSVTSFSAACCASASTLCRRSSALSTSVIALKSRVYSRGKLFIIASFLYVRVVAYFSVSFQASVSMAYNSLFRQKIVSKSAAKTNLMSQTANTARYPEHASHRDAFGEIWAVGGRFSPRVQAACNISPRP